jgi:sec-independent protein translocase protein TatB
MALIVLTGVLAGSAAKIETASIGIPDTMLLMMLALMVFGPRRLPEIGRQIGKLMYEFRKVSNDFKFQMEEELRASEEAERQKKLQLAATSPLPPEPAPLHELASGYHPHSEPQFTPENHTIAGESDPAAYSAVAPEAEPQQSFAESMASHSTSNAELKDEPSEPRRFPPVIQPPSSGEPVAAARPFRNSGPSPEPSAPDHSATGVTPTSERLPLDPANLDSPSEAHHA